MIKTFFVPQRSPDKPDHLRVAFQTDRNHIAWLDVPEPITLEVLVAMLHSILVVADDPEVAVALGILPKEVYAAALDRKAQELLQSFPAPKQVM